MHVNPQFQPLLREVGLDADGVFDDPRIRVWRTLPDRENGTLDEARPDGSRVRLHVKRYPAAAAGGIGETPAEVEARGHEFLATRGIPTAPLVGWGVLPDRRSFTLWLDLAGHTPGDKLVDRGFSFDRLLDPTADLAGKLHAAGLHHRDLYLCHFMADPGAAGGGGGTGPVDVRLIDVARVRPLPRFLTRRRWVVKDLAQFWYSTTKLPAVTDDHRERWLARYAAARGDGTRPASLRGAILRKVAAIARHDARLNARQPGRNVSIPAAAAMDAGRDPL